MASLSKAASNCSVVISYIWKIRFFDAFLFGRGAKKKELKFNLFPISPHFFYFLSIGVILAFYFSFVIIYSTMFPEKDPWILPNPLQVIAQLACFFFLYFYKRGDVQQRHLCLLILFFSIGSSLYLQGIQICFLFFFFFLYSISICFFPLEKSEKALFVLLSVYCADCHLSRWGFYLVFQQLCYFFISFFLEKEPKPFVFSILSSLTILLNIQLFLGFFFYSEIYLKEPLRLASLLSGACIVFLCLRERAMREFFIAFFIYFIVSSIIAIAVSPTNTATIFGIPSGMFIFIQIHFFFLIFLFIFLKVGSLKGMQPLIPIFFSVLFMILLHLPEVEWLERWIEGADLLLVMLSVFSILENKNGSSEGK